MLLTKSPTSMKSPLAFMSRAMMLLKCEHSSLSSFSWVHSHNLTVLLILVNNFPLKDTKEYGDPLISFSATFRTNDVHQQQNKVKGGLRAEKSIKPRIDWDGLDVSVSVT